jgi:hypothetical protein
MKNKRISGRSRISANKTDYEHRVQFKNYVAQPEKTYMENGTVIKRYPISMGYIEIGESVPITYNLFH